MQQPQAKKLTDYGKPVSFPRGTSIYEADFMVNEPSVFLIIEGRVEVVKKYTPLQTEVFEYGKGDIFGMLEVYTGASRLTAASAVTDVEALAFDRASLERAMTANLNFAVQAIRVLSRMLRQVNARIKKLT